MSLATEMREKAKKANLDEEKYAKQLAINYFNTCIKTRIEEAAAEGLFYIENPYMANDRANTYLFEVLKENGFEIDTCNPYNMHEFYIKW